MDPTASLSMPTGTVTLLFTDVEDSSRLWESNRDAMAAALRRHDAILRQAIAAHGGYVFKTVGDAFCAAFQSAPAAVGAALDAQRALNAADFSALGELRVRMAIHTGQCEERDRDYFGSTVNRAARLLDIAHGGQILLSDATSKLMDDQFPAGVLPRDLGAHRLKDLAHPEQVHQLVANGLPSEFPALRSLEANPNNLPFQFTSFVGRENDIAEVKALLAEHRLVTLVGAGGVGKTRLALQVGAQLLHDYSDGVWFVELAPLRDPKYVPTALAKSFDLAETAHLSMTELVVGYLKRRHALLIVDNCEHVIGAVAELVDALLQNCKDVRVLATSREPIKILGEHSVRVTSLSVPEKNATLTVGGALAHGAVALFVERAKSISSRFTLDEGNVTAVAELCRRLDGIALAIELAAAQVKVLSVEHLSQKLDDRFRLLTGGSRTALARQKTMRALIDWSYDLLSEKEQRLFCRLSVFANGWSMQAACSVCRDKVLEEWAIVDGLASLVDKSLVVANLSAIEERFTLFESTREYALEKLASSGEREAFERAHAAYFAGLAEGNDVTWETMPTRAWLTPISLEEDNFRAALDFTIEKRRDPGLGAALVARLPRYWWTAARQIEGLRWYQAAFNANDERVLTPNVVARMWYGISLMHSTTLMRREAKESTSRAVTLARACNDQLLLGWSLLNLGVACALMGDPTAGRSHCKEGLVIALERGSARLTAWLKWALALNDYVAGNLENARQTLEEELLVAQQLGDELLHGFVLVFLGNVELGLGNAERALQYARDSLELYLRIDDRISAANALTNIAPCHLALGNIADVRSAAREALSYASDAQNSRSIAIAVEYLSAVAAREGDPALAARLLGYADAWYRDSLTPRDITEQKADAQTMERLRDTLSSDQLAAELSAGAALSESHALDAALHV
jgi:predicted ATPase/class 3 adenylate cyclase